MCLTIRDATHDDAGLILHFIRELATYERAEHEVKTDEAGIKDSLFGPDSSANALICERDGNAIGFAVYFFNYSTWLGRRGLYLEDLYISTSERGAGAGTHLLRHLARLAVSNGCGRFEWSVLDWNEPAIRFYQSLGAKPKTEWVGYRLEGKPLQRLADS